MDSGWFRIVEGGIELVVRLTPKSSRDDVDGIETGADGQCYLKARVRAVPEKGKANKALIVLLAKRTGLPKSTIGLTSGGTSRMKTILIQCDAQEWREALAGLVR